MERYADSTRRSTTLATLFFSYSHKDEALRDQLQTQLSMLKRQGVIDTWHDRRIVAGENLDQAISTHVENDDIILLLVSPDFLASDYCYEVEMTRAMERHASRDAVVIPVILRPCDWHAAPFGKLMATPTDGRPVTQWPDRDEAFLDVVRSVRATAERLRHVEVKSLPAHAPQRTPAITSSATRSQTPPRSSNLALAKRFSDRDKDAFLHEAFDYMASFFENSLSEIGARNSGVEGAFRRVDANRFFATVYRNGKAVTRCTIFMGGMLGRGINFHNGETSDSNSCNESVNVDADDQTCFLRPMMSFGRQSEPKLTFEGAAEYLWQMFIHPLQSR